MTEMTCHDERHLFDRLMHVRIPMEVLQNDLRGGGEGGSRNRNVSHHVMRGPDHLHLLAHFAHQSHETFKEADVHRTIVIKSPSSIDFKLRVLPILGMKVKRLRRDADYATTLLGVDPLLPVGEMKSPTAKKRPSDKGRLSVIATRPGSKEGDDPYAVNIDHRQKYSSWEIFVQVGGQYGTLGVDESPDSQNLLSILLHRTKRSGKHQSSISKPTLEGMNASSSFRSLGGDNGTVVSAESANSGESKATASRGGGPKSPDDASLDGIGLGNGIDSDSEDDSDSDSEDSDPEVTYGDEDEEGEGAGEGEDGKKPVKEGGAGEDEEDDEFLDNDEIMPSASMDEDSSDEEEEAHHGPRDVDMLMNSKKARKIMEKHRQARKRLSKEQLARLRIKREAAKGKNVDRMLSQRIEAAMSLQDTLATGRRITWAGLALWAHNIAQTAVHSHLRYQILGPFSPEDIYIVPDLAVLSASKSTLDRDPLVLEDQYQNEFVMSVGSSEEKKLYAGQIRRLRRAARRRNAWLSPLGLLRRFVTAGDFRDEDGEDEGRAGAVVDATLKAYRPISPARLSSPSSTSKGPSSPLPAAPSSSLSGVGDIHYPLEFIKLRERDMGATGKCAREMAALNREAWLLQYEQYSKFARLVRMDIECLGYSLLALLLRRPVESWEIVNIRKHLGPDRSIYDNVCDQFDVGVWLSAGRLPSLVVDLLQICLGIKGDYEPKEEVKMKKEKVVRFLVLPHITQMQEVLTALTKALKAEDRSKLWRKQKKLTAADETLARSALTLNERVMALKAEQGVSSAQKRNSAHKNKSIFDMLSPKEQDKIVRRREARSQALRNQADRLRYMHYANFHHWTPRELRRWIYESIATRLREAWRVRRPTVINRLLHLNLKDAEVVNLTLGPIEANNYSLLRRLLSHHGYPCHIQHAELGGKKLSNFELDADIDTCTRCIARDITHIVTNSLDSMGLSLCFDEAQEMTRLVIEKNNYSSLLSPSELHAKRQSLDIDFLLRSFHELPALVNDWTEDTGYMRKDPSLEIDPNEAIFHNDLRQAWLTSFLRMVCHCLIRRFEDEKWIRDKGLAVAAEKLAAEYRKSKVMKIMNKVWRKIFEVHGEIVDADAEKVEEEKQKKMQSLLSGADLEEENEGTLSRAGTAASGKGGRPGSSSSAATDSEYVDPRKTMKLKAFFRLAVATPQMQPSLPPPPTISPADMEVSIYSKYQSPSLQWFGSDAKSPPPSPYRGGRQVIGPTIAAPVLESMQRATFLRNKLNHWLKEPAGYAPRRELLLQRGEATLDIDLGFELPQSVINEIRRKSRLISRKSLNIKEQIATARLDAINDMQRRIMLEKEKQQKEEEEERERQHKQKRQWLSMKSTQKEKEDKGEYSNKDAALRKKKAGSKWGFLKGKLGKGAGGGEGISRANSSDSHDSLGEEGVMLEGRDEYDEGSGSDGGGSPSSRDSPLSPSASPSGALAVISPAAIADGSARGSPAGAGGEGNGASSPEITSKQAQSWPAPKPGKVEGSRWRALKGLVKRATSPTGSADGDENDGGSGSGNSDTESKGQRPTILARMLGRDKAISEAAEGGEEDKDEEEGEDEEDEEDEEKEEEDEDEKDDIDFHNLHVFAAIVLPPTNDCGFNPPVYTTHSADAAAANGAGLRGTGASRGNVRKGTQMSCSHMDASSLFQGEVVAILMPKSDYESQDPILFGAIKGILGECMHQAHATRDHVYAYHQAMHSLPVRTSTAYHYSHAEDASLGGAPEQEQLSQAHMPRLDRPSAGSGSSSGEDGTVPAPGVSKGGPIVVDGELLSRDFAHKTKDQRKNVPGGGAAGGLPPADSKMRQYQLVRRATMKNMTDLQRAVVKESVDTAAYDPEALLKSPYLSRKTDHILGAKSEKYCLRLKGLVPNMSYRVRFFMNHQYSNEGRVPRPLHDPFDPAAMVGTPAASRASASASRGVVGSADGMVNPARIGSGGGGGHEEEKGGRSSPAGAGFSAAGMAAHFAASTGGDEDKEGEGEGEAKPLAPHFATPLMRLPCIPRFLPLQLFAGQYQYYSYGAVSATFGFGDSSSRPTTSEAASRSRGGSPTSQSRPGSPQPPRSGSPQRQNRSTSTAGPVGGKVTLGAGAGKSSGAIDAYASIALPTGRISASGGSYVTHRGNMIIDGTSYVIGRTQSTRPPPPLIVLDRNEVTLVEGEDEGEGEGKGEEEEHEDEDEDSHGEFAHTDPDDISLASAMRRKERTRAEKAPVREYADFAGYGGGANNAFNMSLRMLPSFDRRRVNMPPARMKPYYLRIPRLRDQVDNARDNKSPLLNGLSQQLTALVREANLAARWWYEDDLLAHHYVVERRLRIVAVDGDGGGWLTRVVGGWSRIRTLPSRPLQQPSPDSTSVYATTSKYSVKKGLLSGDGSRSALAKQAQVSIRPVSVRDSVNATDIEELLASTGAGTSAGGGGDEGWRDELRAGHIQLLNFTPGTPSAYAPSPTYGSTSTAAQEQGYPSEHHLLQVQHRAMAVNRHGAGMPGYYSATAADAYLPGASGGSYLRLHPSSLPAPTASAGASRPGTTGSQGRTGSRPGTRESDRTSSPASNTSRERGGGRRGRGRLNSGECYGGDGDGNGVISVSPEQGKSQEATAWASIAVFLSSGDMLPALQRDLGASSDPSGATATVVTGAGVEKEALDDEDEGENREDHPSQPQPELQHEYAALFPPSIHQISPAYQAQVQEQAAAAGERESEEDAWLRALEEDGDIAPVFRKVHEGEAERDREMAEALELEEQRYRLDNLGKPKK